jgi:uroporphyrinogen III methyltransferase/synthase
MLTHYDWVVFTSVNGVQACMSRLHYLGYDSRDLAGVMVCAIGPATAAELKAWGIKTDCLPKRFTSEGIVAALASRGEIDGRTFLLPRSQIAGKSLPTEIRGLGGRCVEIVAYNTLPAKENVGAIADLIANDGVDVVMLTSPSAVESYVKILRRARLNRRPGPIVAVIGPVTGQAARENGLKIRVEAGTHTDEGVVRALVSFWKKRGETLHRRERP